MANVVAGDWAHWRGPTQNGVSYDTGLPDKFSLDPKDPNSNLIWTQPYGCRSTPVVMNDRVYILNSAGEGLHEGERVVCFDANNGKVLWEDKFNLFHTDIVSNRVGWTSPVGDPETGNIYIHGTQGFLRCYDKDGKILWNHNLTEEYGRVTGYGGRVVGPTLDGDLLIVGMINGSWGDFARGANRFVAFDKKTGQVVWWSSLPNQIYVTYYSNPVVAVINGQRLLITGGAEGGMHALQVRTGKLVWSYTFARTVINSSPVVDGNYVYCTHGETNLDTNEQGRLVCVDASQIQNGAPKLVWEVVGIKFFYASPVVHDGVVYVCSDSARLYRYDAKTGTPIGRPYAYGVLARGSPVLVDGKIYVFNVNGQMHILKPGKTKIEELHVQKFKPRDGVGFVETNGTPAVANGKMYFGTLESFYCIGAKNGKAGSPPAQPPEDKGDDKVAQIQVLPADVVLPPGGSAEFSVKFFNANGVPLDAKPDGKWDIVLPPKQPDGRQPPKIDGELTSEGLHSKLTVSKVLTGQQGYVEFVRDPTGRNAISGRARVRVAPQLPYKQDFEKVPVGAAPGGWVNTMGKFNVIQMGGSNVLRKVATNPAPPVSRANGYIGLPEMNNYTIQADVSAQVIRDGLPDVGLLNSRYHLILDGKQDSDQKNQRLLRITSWEAKPRINHAVVYDWQPNTWYTITLRVEQTKNSAMIRGKVWQRGQTEPEKWTIEFEDPCPNREGAPAIYAFVSNILGMQPGSEAYFDNVSVLPNGKTAGGGGGGRNPAPARSPRRFQQLPVELIPTSDKPSTSSIGPAVSEACYVALEGCPSRNDCRWLRFRSR